MDVTETPETPAILDKLESRLSDHQSTLNNATIISALKIRTTSNQVSFP
jgi:hypothetical protein